MLRQAVANGGVQSLTPEQLAELLSPEKLEALGIDAKEFTFLLQADPEAALAQLEAAFASKLKLASFASAHKSALDQAAPAEGGAHAEGAEAAASASAGGGGFSPFAILGGVVAAGIGGVLIATDGNGGGGSGGAGGQAVNSPPLANPDTVQATEDTPITFDPRANDTDANNDTLTITQINGTAITATTPVAITGGTISLNANGSLTFTPSPNFNGSPTFNYTISDGNGGNGTSTVTLNVAAVNDAPVNTVANATITGSQNTTIAISGLSVADIDSNSLTTTLRVGAGAFVVGAVAGGATVTGSGTGTLVLTGTQAQINATLAVVNYQGGATVFGQQTITITTSDGQLTDTDTLTLSITKVSSGIVADGYISGARVFVDVNGDGVFNEGEPVGVTDAFGRFAVVGNGTGAIIALGGTNIDTGLANTLVLKAPVGSGVINPLTTLVQTFVERGLDVTQANAAVSRALGLPAGRDLTQVDLLSPSTDAAFALAGQKAAVQIVFTLQIAQRFGGDEAVARALAGIAAHADDAGFSLTNTASLASIFADSGLSGTELALATQLTATANALVASATSLADISTLQTDLSGLVTGANLAPIVGDDATNAPPGQSVTFDPLANDFDPEGSPLTITRINNLDIIAGGAPVDVGSGTVTLNTNGTLTFIAKYGTVGAVAPIRYTVSDGNGGETTGTINVSIDANVGDTLSFAAADGNAVADAAAGLAAQGILHLDVGGPGTIASLTINEARAGALINAGLDFATEDNITVEVAGTTTSTSLKNLQDLHVDTVKLIGHTFTLDAGSAGLGDISGDGLPAFSVGDGQPGDITLNVGGGELDASLDLGSLANQLGASGFNHIDIDGSAIGSLRLSDTQAGALINAGLDFDAADNITVDIAAGTTTSTTLKGLQGLHVDTVQLHEHTFTIDAGAGGLGSFDLSAGNLPNFAIEDGQPIDITLNVDGGVLDSTLDLGALATQLGAIGVDHIDINGSAVGSLRLSDVQAFDLISHGLDFETSDDITVAAHGTHMTTSLSGLQSLHVDAVVGDGVTTLKLVTGLEGGLAALGTGALPQFESSLDVTLDIKVSDLDALAIRAGELYAAGIDHIGLDQEISSLTAQQQSQIADILAANPSLTIDYDPQPAGTDSSFASLMSLLETDPVDPFDAAPVTINDALVSALIESGMAQSLLGEDLVLDATDSGDRLFTSLKSISDLGVDNVLLSDHGADPVYIDLGFESSTPTQAELQQLLSAIDPQHDAQPLFTGSEHVALVLDQNALDALAGVTDALTHLHDLGFTEIDVVGGTEIPTEFGDHTPIPIKLIGETDDLYDYLHHDR